MPSPSARSTGRARGRRPPACDRHRQRPRDARTGRTAAAASASPPAAPRIGTLAPPIFTPPSFRPARSECGGPITLVVDRSGSIGGDMPAVRAGVKQFVNLFDGTPTQLQIVDFATTVERARRRRRRLEQVLRHDASPAPRRPSTDSSTASRSGGSTNWEDALFRTFFTSDGVLARQLGQPVGADARARGVLHRRHADPRPRAGAVRRGVDHDGASRSTAGSAARRATARRSATSAPAAGSGPSRWCSAATTSGSSASASAPSSAPRAGCAARTRANGAIIDGWPTTAPTPHAKFLGNLVAGRRRRPTSSDPADNSYVTTHLETRRRPAGAISTPPTCSSPATSPSSPTPSPRSRSASAAARSPSRPGVAATGENAPFDLTYEVEDDCRDHVSSRQVGHVRRRRRRPGRSAPSGCTPRATDLGAAGYGRPAGPAGPAASTSSPAPTSSYVDAGDLAAGHHPHRAGQRRRVVHAAGGPMNRRSTNRPGSTPPIATAAPCCPSCS